MQATDEDYHRTVRQFQKIARWMMQGRDIDLKDLDLTSIQADALMFFDKHPHSQINGLRDHLSVSHQAACGLVDRMRSKGLLNVEVSDEDARARRVSLSMEGEKTCRELRKRGASAGHAAFDCLTEKEMSNLAETLNRIEAHMKKDWK